MHVEKFFNFFLGGGGGGGRGGIRVALIHVTSRAKPQFRVCGLWNWPCKGWISEQGQ